jgi:peptidoglycan/xylan/chitin deacetylase (PgdA/CDA1 family)
MLYIKKFFCALFFLSSLLFSMNTFSDNNTLHIPILCYHNLNPTKPGSMNMTPLEFETQIKWLKDNGFTIVPLNDIVAYLQGKRTSLPNKPVAITADDGWESVYQYMLPIVKKYQIPVTLFIYPETISAGKHALTWDQLKELQQTGLFDIQGHTYSHPNFKIEKRTLSTDAYQKFVQTELQKSKKILEDKLGKQITLLAWPFGIYDPYLEQAAENAGYVMAFSIDARKALKSDRPMAVPRYMIVEPLTMKSFAVKAD